MRWFILSAAVASAGCGGEQTSTGDASDETSFAEGGADAAEETAPPDTGVGAPCSKAGELGCQGIGQKLQLLCDGTHWVSNGVCSGDTVCDPRPGPTLGSCQSPACVSSAPTCDGAGLITCQADLLTTHRLECASAEHCKQSVGGLCANCLASELMCDGAALMICAPDRQSFVLASTCATSALCDAAGGACTAPTCATDEARCIGDVLERCKPERNGFVTIATCASGLCDATLKKCRDACSTGEYRCSGDVLQACKPDHTGFATVESCGAGLCNATAKACDDCTTGAADCVGSVPRVCDSTGHWVSGTACSGAKPACSGGTCIAGVCGSDEYRCSGDVLERCNSTFTGFVGVKSCGAGLCDAVGKECDECKNGDADCVGSTPRACSSLGHWALLSPCSGSTPLCKAGICEPPVCTAGSYRCNGDTLQTCNAALTGWDDAKNCAVGYCNAAAKQCDECHAGETHCAGDVPQTCDATRHWSGATACSAPTPVCTTSGCIPSPKGWITIASSFASRDGHTAIWTGSKMIVHGGDNGSGTIAQTASYDPTSDTWELIGGQPLGFGSRRSHVAVWTGTEMLVWGGDYIANYRGDGASYDPVARKWTLLPTTGAPSARTEAVAVWSTTTNEMIVWGGRSGTTTLSTGARFTPSPSGGTWKAMAAPPPGFGARTKARAVWTGSKMIIFGGRDASATDFYNSAASYDPVTDSWTLISPTTTTLDGRIDFAAQLIGSRVYVWGGYGALVSSSTYRDNGAFFDGTKWTAMTTPTEAVLLESKRAGMASWTDGSLLYVWGGEWLSTANGAVYDPVARTWTALPLGNAPTVRAGATAVWTGKAAIVWGGKRSGSYPSDGRMYWP